MTTGTRQLAKQPLTNIGPCPPQSFALAYDQWVRRMALWAYQFGPSLCEEPNEPTPSD